MFDENLCIKSVFAGVFITLIAALAVLCSAQDTDKSKYIEPFQEGLRKCYTYRDPYIGLVGRHRGLKNHGEYTFEPIAGLDEPNAIPFLVDILNNGPKWLPEEKHHIARCYAAVCLGATKDPQALKPLVDIMSTEDQKEGRQHVAKYAALALAFLADPNGVEPLVDAVYDNRPSVCRAAVWALGEIGDYRAIHPILEELKKQEDTLVRADYGKAVAKIARTKVPYEKLSNSQYWTEWWEKGPKFTQERFNSMHSEWNNMKKETEGEKRVAQRKLNETADLGIPALPFMVEKVREGESQFIPLISKLTDSKLNKNATKAECLDWWENNKDKWLIPFPDANESPADTNATG